jgi:tetratricopeptide (TPR) repeat protein
LVLRIALAFLAMFGVGRLQATESGPEGYPNEPAPAKQAGAGQSLAELVGKARKLYQQHDYQGCLELLRAIDRTRLTDAALRAEHEALEALAATGTLPRGASPLSPFASRADADKAYQGLIKAQKLLAGVKQELPVNARVKLALAAAFKTAPDHPLARQLAAKLVAEEQASNLGAAALPLLFMRTQVQESPEKAIGAYVDLLKRFEKKDQRAVPAREWFTAVLQAAVTLADGLPAEKQQVEELRPKLAKCYAAYARFLAEHSRDDWLPKDAKQQIFRYASKAVALDGTKAEYWIGRAYSQAGLPNPAWDAVEQDARKALDLGPGQAAAHGLMGYFYLYKSRRQPDRLQKIEALREADRALDRALALTKDNDENKSILLLNHSLVCLELGSYLDLSRMAERKKYLYAATDFAAQAARLPNPRPDWVQVAWGNALEAVGRILQEPGRYPEAVAKFTAAITQYPDQALPRLSRGRCRYQWVVFGGSQDATLLAQAVKDLDDAIALSPQSRAAAEANFWKGMVYQRRQDPGRARETFAQTIDLAERHNGQPWAAEARQQHVQAMLADAWARVQQEPDQALRQADEAAKLVEQAAKAYGPERVTRLLTFVYQLKAEAALHQAEGAMGEMLAKILEAAQDAATKIEELGDTPWADYVRGLAFEYQGDPKQALQAYSEGLQNYPRQAKPIHGLLLIRRTKVRVQAEARVPRAELLEDLKSAIKLVGRDADRASAWALAAVIDTQAANEPGQAESLRQYRREAIQFARNAVKVAGDTHPDRAGIRLVLATNLLLLAKESPAGPVKLAYLNEGLERAREAWQGNHLLAPEERSQLRRLLTLLQAEMVEVEARPK